MKFNKKLIQKDKKLIYTFLLYLIEFSMGAMEEVQGDMMMRRTMSKLLKFLCILVTPNETTVQWFGGSVLC